MKKTLSRTRALDTVKQKRPLIPIPHRTPAPLRPVKRLSSFARTEIADNDQAPSTPPQVSVTDIGSATARCDMFNGGRGLFDDATEKMVSALVPAYALLLASAGAEREAFLRLKCHPLYASHKRVLKENNLAKAAVYLAAKPKTREQRTACSEYASILVWAADNKISVSEFPRAASEVSLRRCQDYAREKRRNAKRRDQMREIQMPTFWLEIGLGGPGVEPSRRLKIEFPLGVYSAAKKIVEADAAEANSIDTLRALLAVLEAERPAEVQQQP